MKKLSFYLPLFASTVFSCSCSDPVVTKTSEQMCVEAQMVLFDQAEQNTKQREYYDSAFKSRDAYNAWAWRECMKK